MDARFNGYLLKRSIRTKGRSNRDEAMSEILDYSLAYSEPDPNGVTRIVANKYSGLCSLGSYEQLLKEDKYYQ